MAKTQRSAGFITRKSCESRSVGKWTLADFCAWLVRHGVTPAFEVVHDHRGEHWLWTGALSKGGYGVCWLPGVSGKPRRTVFVHRLSFMATEGEIPAGQQVRHRCQHRNCATRWHLLIGTRLENARDKREAVR